MSILQINTQWFHVWSQWRHEESKTPRTCPWDGVQTSEEPLGGSKEQRDWHPDLGVGRWGEWRQDPNHRPVRGLCVWRLWSPPPVELILSFCFKSLFSNLFIWPQMGYFLDSPGGNRCPMDQYWYQYRQDWHLYSNIDCVLKVQQMFEIKLNICQPFACLLGHIKKTSIQHDLNKFWFNAENVCSDCNV